ncbi:P-loop containing nucleoside triphosphate hydrolase protein [Pisolithus marmoratus]|nr:P-loop containing nucleoside triphosphate hydrolase protein [Pisolithus marmoratus]
MVRPTLPQLPVPVLPSKQSRGYILLSDHNTSQLLRIASISVLMDIGPSALQTVQSMRVSLYFDNADGFGEWRVLIGTSATKKLREFRRNDANKFKMVYRKIGELSRGQFSGDNQKRVDGTRSGVPIFEAHMQQDLRLVYQVDCVPDHGDENDDDKFDNYRCRCICRNKPVRPGEKAYLPVIFPSRVHDVVVKLPSLTLGDQKMDQLHSLLVLDKYVIFSQALLNGLIAKNDVQHVHELTSARLLNAPHHVTFWVEVELGEFIVVAEIDEMLITPRKTTTMLFKMLGIQRAWRQRHSEGHDISRPRQLFVTKSQMLANKVEEYFLKLLESLTLAGCTLEELARLKPRRVDQELVDDDDDVPDIQNGIPQRYSELEDHHFPLFLTFDRLARMIAADILEADHAEAKRITKLFMRSHDAEALDSFVSYSVFVNTYWPRFPQNLTKGRDPWLVFGEIMGVIKGSEKSLVFDDGALDKKTYCALLSRSNPTFSGQRECVYAIYEAYSKLKYQHQHHDVADRTHAILKTLLGGSSLKGHQVDFLYVDETQDNLLIDALLLRLLCNNPKGLFWAGDTAQTVSASSSFRFDDLKAFLSRIEVNQTSHMMRERAAAQPVSFQLTINYRSHGGILNCTRSVVELISHFWPNSIDSLQPEHGIVDGLKPIFFTGRDKDTFPCEQFLSRARGSHKGFGARQYILVRNDKAKEKLEQQVGAIGVVMTIYEAKGLEADDVFLYNFFEDSNVDLSRWRLVLAATGGVGEGCNQRQRQVPCFERDENRYAGVCSELKFLYVGMTRACKRLWIVDNSDKAEPMKSFWTSRSQIQICTPETDVTHLAVSSTDEEWAESGYSLFQHKRYTQAMHCFECANMPREMKIAQAYHLRQLARAMTGISQLSEQSRAFAEAADAFVKCGSEAPGRVKLQYYRTAAECYVRAADDHKAADAYLNAEEYEQAAERYRNAGIFNKTVDVLKFHSKEVSHNCAEESTTQSPCSKDDERPPPSLIHWLIFIFILFLFLGRN